MNETVEIVQEEQKPLQNWRWKLEKSAGGDKVI